MEPRARGEQRLNAECCHQIASPLWVAEADVFLQSLLIAAAQCLSRLAEEQQESSVNQGLYPLANLEAQGGSIELTYL